MPRSRRGGTPKPATVESEIELSSGVGHGSQIDSLSLRPGCFLWLKPQDHSNPFTCYARRAKDGVRTTLDDGAYGHAVIILDRAKTDPNLITAVMLTTFGGQSHEEWKMQLNRFGHRNSIPLLSQASVTSKEGDSGELVEDTLTIEEGFLKKDMYVMTERTLEIPAESLRPYSKRKHEKGEDPPRLCFESFDCVMDAVGLHNNHRSIYDGERSPESDKITGEELSLSIKPDDHPSTDPTPAEAYAPFKSSWLPKQWSPTELGKILAATAGSIDLVRANTGRMRESSAREDLADQLQRMLVFHAAPAKSKVLSTVPNRPGSDSIFSEENMWVPWIKGPFWKQIFSDLKYHIPYPPPKYLPSYRYSGPAPPPALYKTRLCSSGEPRMLLRTSSRLIPFPSMAIQTKRKWVPKSDPPPPDSTPSPMVHREKRKLLDNRSFSAREREARALDVLRHHLVFQMQNSEHERTGLRDRKAWVRRFMKEKRAAISGVIFVFEEERSRAVLEELVEDEVEVV